MCLYAAVDAWILFAVLQISTPLCSAHDLEDFKQQNNDPLMCCTPSNSDQIVYLEPDIFASQESQAED